jgi:serine/threonine protein kinase
MHPTKLGRFEIIREIGRGAMGQVFLAKDPKIERHVAIKTVALPPGTSDAESQEARQRFLREAQAAGKLLHPNIVTIFDMGEEAGVSFIAMEYIEGTTLEAYTKAETLLPLSTVLDFITQAAEALDYAHLNNVIHRDIKSANLMVMKDGTLKITDFGLAKSPASNLTQSGVVMGTPSYIAPEQIQGKEVDGRSDIFSLGVVLYELLTGVRPFEAESISTVIYRVLYEDPRPPAAHNPALPPEVNLVLEKALAKSPDRRHTTGAELVADLRKALSALPESALTTSFPAARRSGTSGEPSRRKTASGPPTTMRTRGETAPSRNGASVMQGSEKIAVTGGAPAPPTLMAHHPGKIATVMLTVLAAIVIFPRLVNRHEPMPEPAPGRSTASPGTPDVRSAAIGGGPGDASGAAGAGSGDAGPGGARGQIAIEVETVPHGGAVFLDSIPLAQPVIVLSRSDPHPHDIVAKAGCRQATAEMTAADLASFKGSLVLELQNRREEVPIGSEPPGARVVLNGRVTGKATPAKILLDGCEERTLTLQLEGYRPWTRTYTSDSLFDQMTSELAAVSLDPIPKGTILVKTQKKYEVEIYAGGTRLGRSGEPITLVEGKHALTFRNDRMFLRTTAQVAVSGGRTVTPLVEFPALGALTVQAQPSNCKVFVDDVYVDVTPLLDLPIASGSHTVRVVFVPNGTKRDVAVNVVAGETARVVVKF